MGQIFNVIVGLAWGEMGRKEKCLYIFGKGAGGKI
jgi:hypothetical protein